MIDYSFHTQAYPSLLHPEPLALWQFPADRYLCRRCSNTVLSQSLWGPWVLLRTRFVWASECLWWEWGLIPNMNLPLLPSCWGFSFALGRGVSPHSCSSAMGFFWPRTWGISSLPLQRSAAVAPDLGHGVSPHGPDFGTTQPPLAASAPDLGHGVSSHSCSRATQPPLAAPALCRVHHEKHWAGWSISWNQDCWEKYQ